MSHTNSTTNYGLPQFLTGDKPAWLTDVNNAFSDIDSAIYAAQTKADTAFTDAGNAQSDATTAINNAAAADAKGSGALASIETAFDPTTIYSVGAKVIYNSLLYRCIVAVTTPGPWTGSDNWERITVDSLISTTDSKIGSLTSLATTDKTSAVNAINEVNGKVTDTATIPFTASAALSTNNCQIFRTGLWVVVAIEIVLSSDQTGWYDFITTTTDVSLPAGVPFFGVVCTDSESVMPKYCQAYQNGSKMSIRIRNAKANQQYRGQIVFPLASI